MSDLIDRAKLLSELDQHRPLWEGMRRSIVIELIEAQPAAPSPALTRATAKGTNIDVDEWGRPLYVFSDGPSPALTREALAPILRAWFERASSAADHANFPTSYDNAMADYILAALGTPPPPPTSTREETAP